MMDANQLNASQKSSLNQWFELADKALDETEKMVDFHLNACRGTLQDMAHCCRSACDVRDLPGAFNWHSSVFKPFAERSAEYGARWMGLTSDSGLNFSRSFEAQWEFLGRQMNAWMGPGVKAGAPGESLDYLRNAMHAFDSVWDTMRQNMLKAPQTLAQGAVAEPPQDKGGERKNRP